MLEAMLAFVVAAMILSATYALVAQSLTAERKARLRHDMTALARALLDEYTITYPRMATLGRYRDSWDWTITEADVSGLRPTAMDRYFTFVEVTAQVELVDGSANPVTLSTVVARRAQ